MPSIRIKAARHKTEIYCVEACCLAVRYVTLRCVQLEGVVSVSGIYELHVQRMGCKAYVVLEGTQGAGAPKSVYE